MRVIIFSLVAMFVVSLTGLSSVEAAKKSGKLTQTSISKASGIPFLTSRQISQLSFQDRVAYIKLFRKTFKELDEIQKNFANSKVSHLDLERHELFRLLFGVELFAAEKQHDRGADCDQCIYSLGLQDYPKVNGQCVAQPFRCPRPTCTIGGSSNGSRCDPVVSGLKYSQGGCRVSPPRTSTVDCIARMAGLASETANKKRIEALTNESLRLFPIGKQPQAALDSLEVKTLVEGLVDTLYSPESYASLLHISEVFKGRQMDLPLDDSECKGLSRQVERDDCLLYFKKLKTALGGGFDSITTALDSLFGKFMNMCGLPLTNRQIQAIERLDNAQEGSSNRSLEEQRKFLLQQAREQRIPVDSFNVLQKPECFSVWARRSSIELAYAGLRDKTPIETPLPPEDKPDSEIRALGCSTDSRLQNSWVFSHAGRCSLCSMDRAVANIGRGGAKDLEAVSVDGDPKGEKPLTGDFKTSFKWSQLLGIMTKTCGMAASEDANMKDFTFLRQVFGQCSQRVYDWGSSDEKLQPSDRSKIDKWTVQNYWNNVGAKKVKRSYKAANGRTIRKKVFVPEPDENNDFARIFGLSYAQATEIFCDPLDKISQGPGGVYVKSVGTRNEGSEMLMETTLEYAKKGQTKDLDPALRKALDRCKEGKTLADRTACQQSATVNALNRRERMERARARARYAIDNHIIANQKYEEDTAADDVAACLDESLRRAERIFNPDDDNARCMDVAPLVGADGQLNTLLLERELEGQQPFAGNVIFNSRRCATAHQVETYYPQKGGASKKSYGFFSPDSSSLGLPGSAQPTLLRRPSGDRMEYGVNTVLRRKDSAAQLKVDVHTFMDQRIENSREEFKPTHMTVGKSCREYFDGVTPASKEKESESVNVD